MTSTCAAGSGGDPLDRRARQDVAVEHGLPRHPLATTAVPQRSGSGSASSSSFSPACAASSRWTPTPAIASRVDRHPQLPGQVSGDAQRVLSRRDLVGCAALQDRPPEQPLGAGHREQHADAHRPCGLAEDRHVARVPAEGSDVLPHPLQRRHLIEQAEVGDAVAEIEEPLRARDAS